MSVYRPYDSPPSSVGSLRNAITVLILKDSEVTTVIGGDFNLDGASVDERVSESTFFRIPYEEASSFRKLYLGSYQGSSIDHVLSNRGSVESYVTSDGLYIGDHFPVIAVIKTDCPSVVRNRLEVKAPLRLKSSDKGGLRRLNRALERKFSGDISTYTIAAITDWTVREERRIAASRSSKFNSNGWSPTSRLLQVKLRLLGALLKRLLDGAGTAGCHSMYADARKDMAAIKLSDEEEEWLDGVVVGTVGGT